MAVTTIARIAMVGDAGGASAANKAVAQAISASFSRFVNAGGNLTNTWLFGNGDMIYPQSQTTNEAHVNATWYYSGSLISRARTVATPGNHDNGTGSGSTPNIQSWINQFITNATASRMNGWITQAEGIPNTDQFVDISGVRFHFLNSGAVESGNATPGWPVPHTGGSVSGNARVARLRGAWAPGLTNVVVTHHGRYSYYGNHHDNPTMQNLVNEFMGVNDSSGPHGVLWLSCHDHNMQLFQPQGAAGTFPGVTYLVGGECGSGNYTPAGPASQTSQKSWLQFANINLAGGFTQIDIQSDGTMLVQFIDGTNNNGNLMTNTSSTGVTGAAKTTVRFASTVNAAPTHGTPVLTDTTPTVGSTTTADPQPSTWDGTPAPAFAYQWQIATASTGPWSNISGATGASYTPVSGDSTKFLQCVVTGSNASGSLPVATGASSAVAATASVPTASTPRPSITAGVPATVGVALVCDHGTWNPNGTIDAYHYAWVRKSASGTTNAIGTDSTTYTPVPADVGFTITCNVTAHNASGMSAAVSTGYTGAVLSAGGNNVQDSFNRTVANGLGTADSGHVYNILQGNANQFSVNGSAMVMAAVAGNSPLVDIAGYDTADGFAMMKFRLMTAPVGGLQSTGLDLRVTDQLTYMRCVIEYLPGGTNTLRVDRQNNNVNFAIGNKTALSVLTIGSWYWCRMEVQGQTYKVWVWPDGTAQPGTPTMTAVDNGQGGPSSSYTSVKRGVDGGGFCNAMAADPLVQGRYLFHGDVYGSHVSDNGCNSCYPAMRNSTYRSSNPYGRACMGSKNPHTPGRAIFGSGGLKTSDASGELAYVDPVNPFDYITADTAHGLGTGLASGTSPAGRSPRPVGRLIDSIYDSASGIEYIFWLSGGNLCRTKNSATETPGTTVDVIPLGTTQCWSSLCILDVSTIVFTSWNYDLPNMNAQNSYIGRVTAANIKTGAVGTFTATHLTSSVPNKCYDIRTGKDGHTYAACDTQGVYEVTFVSGTSVTFTPINSAFFDAKVVSVDAASDRTLWVGQANDSAGPGSGDMGSSIHVIAKGHWTGSVWTWTWATTTATTDGTKTYQDGDGTTPTGPRWWLWGAFPDIQSAGMDVSVICVDPFDDNTITLCGRGGAWQTRDAGAHFYPSMKGLGGGEAHNIKITGGGHIAATDQDYTGSITTDHYLTAAKGPAPTGGHVATAGITFTGLDGATYKWTPSSTSLANCTLQRNGVNIHDNYMQSAARHPEFIDADQDGYVYISLFGGGILTVVPPGSSTSTGQQLTHGSVGIRSQTLAGNTSLGAFQIDAFSAGPIGSVPTTNYSYNLDSAGWVSTGFAKTASPGTLAPGLHTMEVEAIDSVTGTSDEAQYAWMVSGVGPSSPAIVSVKDTFGNNIAEGGSTFDTNLIVNFTTDPGTTVRAIVDSHIDQPITSPYSISGLSTAPHLLQLIAIDVNGIASPATEFSWTVAASPTGPGSGTYSRQIVLPNGVAGSDVLETIYVRATDLQNPPQTTVQVRNIVLHLPLSGGNPPSVGITYPDDGSTLYALDTTTIVDVVPDPTGSIVSVVLTSDTGTTVDITANVSGPVGGVYTYTGDIDVLQDDATGIACTVTDSNGNVGSDSVTVNETSVQPPLETAVSPLPMTFLAAIAEYKIVHYDYNGNAVGQIKGNELGVSMILDDIPSATYSISLESQMSKKAYCDPDRHDWKLFRNNKLITGGYIASAEVNTDNRVLAVTAQGYLGYLAKRVMPFDPSGNLTAQYKVYNNVDLFEAVRRILDYVVGTSNSIPLTFSPGNSGVVDTYNFDPSNRDDMLTILQNLAQSHPGFDYEIDGNCTLHMYAPQKGVQSQLTLGLHTNVVSVDLTNIGIRGNRVLSSGAGTGNSTAIRFKEDVTSQNAGRIVDDVMDFGTVASLTQLNSLANAELALAIQPQLSFTITGKPDLGENWWELAGVGDWIYVDVDLEYEVVQDWYRCTQIDMAQTAQGDELFTYTFAPNVVG